MILVLQTVHHNAYHDDPYAREFGIKISEKLASVEARILPAPWVSSCFSNSRPVYFFRTCYPSLTDKYIILLAK